MKRFITGNAIVLAILVAVVLVLTRPAEAKTATNVFHGVATTGQEQPMPVDVNPADQLVREDGAVGLGYSYKATGRASGDLPGDFLYQEHGYLFFRDPADPTTFAGSKFVSGVFTLNPDGGKAPITIADTCPSCYTSGVEEMDRASLTPEAQRVLDQLLERGILVPNEDGKISYGYFTFTNAHGTFTGYASPDFREFTISITFDVSGSGDAGGA